MLKNCVNFLCIKNFLYVDLWQRTVIDFLVVLVLISDGGGAMVVGHYLICLMVVLVLICVLIFG